MPVIAKMGTQSVEDYGYSRRIKLSCVYDGNVNNDRENHGFTKATPSGECWMTVDNSAVWPQFILPNHEEGRHQGSQHYVVFVDAGKNTLQDVLKAIETLG